MTHLEKLLERTIQKQGKDSPVIPFLRKQIAAEKAQGKSFQSLYLTGAVKARK